MKMGKLEAPDTHFLSFAEGWMELGDCQSALDELELISVDDEDPALLRVDQILPGGLAAAYYYLP